MSELSEFDIIICTCNRQNIIANLLDTLFHFHIPLLKNLIVVDSSDEKSQSLMDCSKIIYVHTSHKNQPYQRFLGARISNSNILVFMDDDIDIIDPIVFDIVLGAYQKEQNVGSTIGIDYQSATLDRTSSPLRKFNKWIPNSILVFTGNYIPSPGKISFLGLSGPHLGEIKKVEFFHGPFFSVRREVFSNVFDPRLLALYEQKLGKGEDKVLSLKVSQYGFLAFSNRILVTHPPVDSHYFDDVQAFFKRVAVSRYYLTQIYCEVRKRSHIGGILIYIWFISWRLFISFVQSIGSRIARKTFHGYIKGFFFVLRTRFLANLSTDKEYWMNELLRESKAYEEKANTI